MQCSNYQPGFHMMGDLNKNADGCWSEYYDSKSSKNLYNGYQIRKSNGCSEYDKEMVKRTMLEHEAIFRKQVYELHRLYRIQKGMMDELKKIACRHLQTNTSESNSFSSQIPSEATKMTLNMVYLPEPTTANRRASITLPDDKNLSYLNNVDMLHSKNKGLPKRMFDLELPADVYVDCEEAERRENETATESACTTVVPPVGKPEGSSWREERSKPDVLVQSGISTPELSDLNEPVEKMCFGRETGSFSSNFISPKSPHVENQGIQLPVRMNTSLSGLPSSSLKCWHYDEGLTSNSLHAVDKHSIWETSLFNNETGQITSSMKFVGPGSLKGKSSLPSEPEQLFVKPKEIISLEQNKRDWFKPMLEIPSISPQYRQKAFPFPCLYSDAKSYSHLPLAVPSFHCFNGADTPNHGNPSVEWQYNGDLLSHIRGVTHSTSYQNGFSQGLGPDYNSRSQLHPSPINIGRTTNDLIEVHLNQTLLNGFLNGITNKKIKESGGKCSDSLGTFSQPQREPTCNPSLMNSSSERKHEEEKRITSRNLQDFPSSSKVEEESTSQMNEISDMQSSKKIFGFLIPARSQKAQTVVTRYDEEDQVKLPTSRDHIDLNFDLNLSDPLVKDEKIPVSAVQVSAPKLAIEINLEEAPIESLEEEKKDEAILAEEAAESILLMSSNKIPCDILHWLAEVAIQSNMDNSKDPIDPFEQMTLELEETKPEEYLRRQREAKDQTDEENDGKSNPAPLLFTKPRRGQARKRRQRRDFQRDVLPGLASLSRQEVTEDLQTIGRLMKASGHCWPSDRNGMSCRRRVARRPRSLAITVGEVHVSPVSPLTNVSNGQGEMEIDGSMIGWGRKTRRCRRQRVLLVTNVAAPPT